MNIIARDLSLPRLIDRASKALLGARSSAEILEAKDLANIAYTAAKMTARLGKAKHAHDQVVAAAHRAQADALEIEAGAKRRLADEYDGAQERGEVARNGGDKSRIPNENSATAADIGLTHREIHEAREIRDAEKREPGIVRRALDEQLKHGKEPTKAALRRAISDDEEYDDEPEAPPSRKRDAFLVFSNEAMLLAKYDGPIDDEVIEAAQKTERAWGRLVAIMEQGR